MNLEVVNKGDVEFSVGDIIVGENYSFLITYHNVDIETYSMVCLAGCISTAKLSAYDKEELAEWIKYNGMKIYRSNKYKLQLIES